jgi:hypothetical protein
VPSQHWPLEADMNHPLLRATNDLDEPTACSVCGAKTWYRRPVLGLQNYWLGCCSDHKGRYEFRSEGPNLPGRIEWAEEMYG